MTEKINRMAPSCNGTIVIKVMLASLVCVPTVIAVASTIVNSGFILLTPQISNSFLTLQLNFEFQFFP